jgi:hypothetical protein
MDQKDESLACTVSEKGVCELSSPSSQESLVNEVKADTEHTLESTATENSTNVSQIQKAVKKNKNSFLSWFSCFYFDVPAPVPVPSPPAAVAEALEETLDLTPVAEPTFSEKKQQQKKPSRVSKASRQAKIIFGSRTVSV